METPATSEWVDDVDEAEVLKTLDADDDGKLSYKEMTADVDPSDTETLQRMKTAMDKTDKDGDGIELDEIDVMMAEMEKPSEKTPASGDWVDDVDEAEVVKTWDANKDGKLSYEEMTADVDPSDTETLQRMKKAMDKTDKDGDGIEVDEVDAMMAEMEKPLEETPANGD